MSGCKLKLVDAGYAIVNDDGELWRTPNDNSMIVPTQSLARRICDEHLASQQTHDRLDHERMGLLS